MNNIADKAEINRAFITKMKDKYRLYLFLIFLLSVTAKQFGSVDSAIHPVLFLTFFALIIIVLIGYIKYMIKFSRALGNSAVSTIFYVIIGIIPLPIICFLPAVFLIRQYTKITGIKVGFLMGDKEK